MATKKQRRRREKLQRHEYEYVVETEEGEEVVVEPPRAGEKHGSKPQGQPRFVDARGREIKRPSWGRVLKRGAIFGPLLLIIVFITNSQLSTGAKILNALVLLLIFLPFSYLVDVLVYRTMLRRHHRQAGR